MHLRELLRAIFRVVDRTSKAADIKLQPEVEVLQPLTLSVQAETSQRSPSSPLISKRTATSINSHQRQPSLLFKHEYQVETTQVVESRHSQDQSFYSTHTRESSVDISSTSEIPENEPLNTSQPAAEYSVPEKQVYVREVEISIPSTTAPAQNPHHLAATTQCKELSILPPLPPIDPKYLPKSCSEDASEIMHRKIWVKRPGASATLVQVQDDDLVDTVRDVILEKYRNSLGKSIDSPDITLRLVHREQGNKSLPQERVLGPDENIGQLLDSQFPDGQTIDDALLIDIPQRRTPKPSPRVATHPHHVPYYYVQDVRPDEGSGDYFSSIINSPHLGPHPHPQTGANIRPSMGLVTHSQAAPLPSPGGHSVRRHRDRPKYGRQHTSSPTIMHSAHPHSDELKPPVTNGVGSVAPLKTPPAPSDHRQTLSATNRPTSPHSGQRRRVTKKPAPQAQPNGDPAKLASAGLLDGKVPPINVLIVEDNNINLRLLEQFMRKLKVRFKSAVNGREAVDTWKQGGFHLVLMDIQLPVMSGLEATKEIRRLEGVNGIGLGLVGGTTANGKHGDHIPPEDKLDDISLFKSPVIIVALTASSLQSDRHEALAVGCNDFLTKPVGFPWMVRKVTEWGCMQALIDFDGWRQWKANAEKQDEGLTEEQKKAREDEERAKRKAALKAMFTRLPPGPRDDQAQSSSGRSPVNGTAHRRSGRGSSGSGTPLETHAEESED